MTSIRLGRCLTAIGSAAIGISGFTHAGYASAATLAVTNCHDSGAGSLREAVGMARSGDTVDLRTLSCQRIELTRTINARQTSLSMVGRGAGALTVDGNSLGRVFVHTGTGTLQLRGMSIVNGHYVNSLYAYGGCIRSEGNVDLRFVRVHHCSVQGPQYVEGGGVSAQSISMYRSTVCDNKVAAGFSGGGGGISGDEVSVAYSTVSSNVANGHRA